MSPDGMSAPRGGAARFGASGAELQQQMLWSGSYVGVSPLKGSKI